MKQVRAIIERDEKYLLLRKVKDVHKDHEEKLEVPGGKVEPGETDKEAVIRELKEETKLKITVIQELDRLKIIKNGIETNTYVIYGKAEPGKIQLSKEHSEFLWLTKKKIEERDDIIFKDFFLKYLNVIQESFP